jgi:5-methylcytosine-specific restriction endonuclease McrA
MTTLFPWSEIEQPPAEKRRRLRAEVYAERSDFFYRQERYVPTCVLCGRPLVEGCGFHAHETIITRADVPAKRWQDLIMVRENISLLCPTCHMRRGHSEAAEEIMVSVLIDRYGKGAILEWLESLPFKVEPMISEALCRDLGLEKWGR